MCLTVAATTSELVSRLRQREREARRRAVESETLSRLSTDLLADVTLETILATVVEQVPRVFELESAAVLLPEETGGLRLRSVYPPHAGRYYLVDREHRAVSGHVFRTGTAAGVGSARRIHRPHGPGGPGPPAARRHRRVLYVPVRAAHGPVGVMGVTAVRAHDFSPEERRLLTTFANPAALASDRPRLVEEGAR